MLAISIDEASAIESSVWMLEKIPLQHHKSKERRFAMLSQTIHQLSSFSH